MRSQADEHEFIERFGRFWEAQGGSRIAGKIVGWMMVCDPPQQSGADIVAALDVSHGSVSTQTRQLETLGYLERTTFPGDRNTYFVLNHSGWSSIMETSWMGPVVELRELATAGVALTESDSAYRSHDLLLMTDFLLAEWPEFVSRMKAYIENSSEADVQQKPSDSVESTRKGATS